MLNKIDKGRKKENKSILLWKSCRVPKYQEIEIDFEDDELILIKFVFYKQKDYLVWSINRCKNSFALNNNNKQLKERKIVFIHAGWMPYLYER